MANPAQEKRARTGGSKGPYTPGGKGLPQGAGVTRTDLHLALWPPRGGVKDAGTAAAVLTEGQQGRALWLGWW